MLFPAHFWEVPFLLWLWQWHWLGAHSFRLPILSISYRQILSCCRFLENFTESFKLKNLPTGLPAVIFVHQPYILLPFFQPKLLHSARNSSNDIFSKAARALSLNNLHLLAPWRVATVHSWEVERSASHGISVNATIVTTRENWWPNGSKW